MSAAAWWWVAGFLVTASVLARSATANPVGEAAVADTSRLSAADVAGIMASVPSIGGVELSPDGRWITYVISQRDVAENRTTPSRIVAPTPGHKSQRSISVPEDAAAVHWCPNSRCLTWLRARSEPDRPSELVMLDIGTGAINTVATVEPLNLEEGGVTIDQVGSDYQLSPDMTHVAFTAATEKGWGYDSGYDPAKGIAVTPDADGFFRPRRALFILECATGELRRASPDSVHVPEGAGLAWSPDSLSIAFAVTSSTEGSWYVRADVAVLGLDGFHMLVRRDGGDWAPAWSPDGAWIAFLGNRGHRGRAGLYPAVVPARGGPVVELLEAPEAYPTGAPAWTPDSRSILYTAASRFESPVVRANVNARAARQQPEFPSQLQRSYDRYHSFSRDRRTVAFTRSSLTTPPDLYVGTYDAHGTPTREPRRITSIAASFPLSASAEVHELHWPSRNGKFTIPGLLLTPAGSMRSGRPEAPLPTLVYLHGGPGQVLSGFALDGVNGAQLPFAARGYAVLVPVTRGRSGWGGAFEAGIRDGGGPGRLPFEDAMAGLDHIVGLGIADDKRTGVYGHSYGGYLTAYTITQTSRFRAAIDHDGGFEDWLGFVFSNVSSDLGLTYRELHGWTDPFDPAQRARMIEESPALNAGRVTTPVLLQRGRGWQNFGLGRGWFNALRWFSVPSVMIVYDEDHVWQRPAAIVDDLTRMGEWFDYWVRDIPYPNAERAQDFNSWRKESTHR